MLHEILQIGGGNLVVPVVAGGMAVFLVRAIFSLHRTRSQDRRDFLEYWPKVASPDDLWLELAIRHIYGEYIPASVIRSLQRASQPALALRQVSSAWPLLEMNDETGEMNWRRRHHRTKTSRNWVGHFLSVSYAVLMTLAVVTAFGLLSIDLEGIAHSYWVFPIFSFAFAMMALAESETLEEADKAVPRWLGLP